MVRRRRSVPLTPSVVVLVASVLVMTLTACTTRQAEEADVDMTVDQAKAETMQIEQSIAAAFRQEDVTSVRQAEDGVLLACADGQWQWTGSIDVTLRLPQDRDAVLQTLAEALSTREGFAAERQDEPDGEVVVGAGPRGLAFVGGFDEETGVVDVVSASRCVNLQEGESSFSTY